MNEFSGQNFYCGGNEIWFSGSVYRAVQDPTLSVTDLSPTATPSLWKKLYAAALYDDSKTYKKGHASSSTIPSTSRPRKPKDRAATAVATWSPFVDADAYDPSESYPSNATVRYMGNQYVSAKTSVGMNRSWPPMSGKR